MTGAEQIAAERKRQTTELDVTDAGDDHADQGEMAGAGAAYALLCIASNDAEFVAEARAFARYIWPWHEFPIKPKTPRENLVRAGALIAAELDRLDRVEAEL